MDVGRRGPTGDTGRVGDTGRTGDTGDEGGIGEPGTPGVAGERGPEGPRSGRGLLVLLAVAAVVVVAVVAVLSTVTLTQGDTIDTNRGAIVRSCEILNEAITKSQDQMNQSEVFKLFAAYTFDTPERQAALKRALAKDAKTPSLAQIDCERVAANPDYHPFEQKR